MADPRKKLRVVGCILKHEDALLMLLRSESETDPSLWGIPAGKVEPGETDLQAIRRELMEETGIALNENAFTHLGELPIEYPAMTVVFPIFTASIDERADITLIPEEHVNFAWVIPEEALKLPNLMRDVDVILERFASAK